MQIQIPITLDISRKSPAAQYVPIGQGDDAYRFNISVKNAGNILKIPDGARVVLNCVKPDGTYTETVGSVENNAAKFDIASNTVAVPGTVICEMQIFDGTQLTTQKFGLRVEPNIINDNAIESTNDYGFIRILISELSNKVDKVLGKGLSENDFTDALKAKLDADYTKEQIDMKITALQDGKANKTSVYTKSETNEAIRNNRPSKSVPVEPSVVSELMRCGVSYLSHKDSLTFTDSGKGTLFDDDFSKESPKIDCSSLMMAWVMGIPYEWSKYAGKNNSRHYDYGIKLPANPYSTERPNRYYTHELAHYFDEQGWCFIPDKNYSDIAPGDIIFVSFKSRDGNSDFHDNAYLKIDHCLLVLGYKDATHLICLHTSEQSTIRFYDVCVLPTEYDSTSTNGYNNGIKLVARLPFKPGHISEKPIFVDSHNEKTTTSTTNGFLTTITLDEPLKINTTYTLVANVENAFAQAKPSTNNYFGIRASYADGTGDETIFSWALNVYPEDNLYRCHFVTGNKEITKLKLYILSCTVAGHVYKYAALYEGSISTTPHESDLSRTQSYKIDKNGNAWFAGNIKVGGKNYDSGETVYTKTETDNAIKNAITAYDTVNMQLLGEDN